MIGKIAIYCNGLEEVNKELELLLRDHYSVVVEQAENVWNYYDGRIRLTAKPNRLLASVTAERRRRQDVLSRKVGLAEKDI